MSAWFSHNGERLGTYEGHNGAVWTIDVDCMSPALFGLPRVNTTYPIGQPNPDFSSPAPPIIPSDSGLSSQANVSMSGNFPQLSNVWLLTKLMINWFA